MVIRETPIVPRERLERLEGEKTVAVLSAAALALLVVLPLISALFVGPELALKLVECGKDFGLISLGAFGSVVYCFLGGTRRKNDQSPAAS